MRFLFLILTTSLASAAPPVSAVAYLPDGSGLVAGVRDTVHAFDIEGKPTYELGGHPGRITGLSANAKWLAVASGDAGKSGIVTLYDRVDPRKPTKVAEFTAHKDAIYALQFSPDGGTLATASYDRGVNLWSLGKEPKLAHTLADHSDSVYALAFHPDGKLLATGAADRAVKIWDTTTGKRLYTLGESTDWVYALAWHPNGKQLAGAGVDKSIRVWNADREGGTVAFGVFAHTAAVSKLSYDPKGETLWSAGEDKVLKAWNTATMVERATLPALPEQILAFALRPDGKQLALGRFDGVLELFDHATRKVQATPLPAKPKAAEDRFPYAPENGNTDSARTAAMVKLPVSLGGSLDRAGDTDYFRFELKPGEQIGIQVQTVAKDAKLFDPVLLLTDSDGRMLVESNSGVLGYTAAKAGTFAIGLQDREFRGGKGFEYRLHIGPIPIVTGVFPLGVTRGQVNEIHVHGVYLGEPGGLVVKMDVPKDTVIGAKLPVPLPKVLGEMPLGAANVVVSEYPAPMTPLSPGGRGVGGEGDQTLEVGTTADGILTKPQDSHAIPFRATKGKKIAVEVFAARYGSPLDSVLEIQDSAGKPVPQAMLRGVAQSFLTLRDADSAAPGIRLDAWNELGWNDYLYAGSELMRIKALPKNQDDDCQFVQVAGKRLGHLGTTPTHHPNGSAVVKVELHPPGSTFPPNGLPVYTLHYRNDDGGPGFGRDSIVYFDPPADGTYKAVVKDTRGMGGSNFAYRLTVRPLRPDFKLEVSPKDPKVWAGGAVPITITANRIDGFEGPIRVKFEDMPWGFRIPGTIIEAEQNSAVVAVESLGDDKPGRAVRCTGTAMIDGKDAVREAVTGTLSVVPQGDIVTVLPLSSNISLRSGRETRIKVQIERSKDFKGRVPLEVQGLPHGVRVLNLGLNGILVLPGETEREIVLYAEKFVKPLEMPVCIVAKGERKKTDHSSPNILLQVK